MDIRENTASQLKMRNLNQQMIAKQKESTQKVSEIYMQAQIREYKRIRNRSEKTEAHLAQAQPKVHWVDEQFKKK